MQAPPARELLSAARHPARTSAWTAWATRSPFALGKTSTESWSAVWKLLKTTPGRSRLGRPTHPLQRNAGASRVEGTGAMWRIQTGPAPRGREAPSHLGYSKTNALSKSSYTTNLSGPSLSPGRPYAPSTLFSTVSASAPPSRAPNGSATASHVSKASVRATVLAPSCSRRPSRGTSDGRAGGEDDRGQGTARGAGRRIRRVMPYMWRGMSVAGLVDAARPAPRRCPHARSRLGGQERGARPAQARRGECCRRFVPSARCLAQVLAGAPVRV